MKHVSARRVRNDYYLTFSASGETYSGPRFEINLHPMSRLLGLDFDVGGEDTDFSLSFRLWFFSLYLSLKGVVPRSWKSYAAAEARAERLTRKYGQKVYAHEIYTWEGRSTGFSIHDGSVWLRFWKSDHGWSSDDHEKWPWNGLGWSWTWHVEDWLLGRAVYEEVEHGEEVPVSIEMPEGTYAATFRAYRCRWNRRWWKGRTMWRTTVEIPDGIPFPGKGENSWDCDDDAQYSTTTAVTEDCPLRHEVINDLVIDVLRRRGGVTWRPAPKPPRNPDNPPAPCEASA